MSQRLRRFTSEAGRVRMLQVSIVMRAWCLPRSPRSRSPALGGLMRVPFDADGLLARPLAQALAGLLVMRPPFKATFVLGLEVRRLRSGDPPALRRRSARPLRFFLPVSRPQLARVVELLTSHDRRDLRGDLLLAQLPAHRFLAGRWWPGGVAAASTAPRRLPAQLGAVQRIRAYLHQGAAERVAPRDGSAASCSGCSPCSRAAFLLPIFARCRAWSTSSCCGCTARSTTTRSARASWSMAAPPGSVRRELERPGSRSRPAVRPSR